MSPIRRAFVFFILQAAIVLGCVAVSSAQPRSVTMDRAAETGPAIETEGLSRREVRELMSQLSDDQVRALLLEQLDRTAAADEVSAVSIVVEIEENSKLLRSRFGEVIAAAPRSPQAIAVLFERVDAAGGLASALIAFVITLVVGLGARWLWHRRVVLGQRDRIARRNASGGAYASIAVFGDSAIWLLLELSGVVIFYAAAGLLLFVFWYDDEILRAVLAAYIAALAVTLAVMAFAEFYLPRDRPMYRLLALNDAAAKRAKGFVLAATIIWTFGFSTCRLMNEFGAEKTPHEFLVLLVATVFMAVLVTMFIALRGDVAALIRGATEDTGGWSHVRNLFASSWHVLACAYGVLLWGMSLTSILLAERAAQVGGVGPGLQALLLIVAVPAVDSIAGSYIKGRFGPDSPLARAIVHMLRVFLVVGASVVFFDLWGIDIDRIEAAGIAGWLITSFFDVAVVALIGYAAWQFMRAWFDSMLEREAPAVPEGEEAARSDGEGGGAGATRAATILPLLRTFTLITIIVMATLTALSGLGVDIGPLLAGAGVVGIAIGFGAQTLVRDVVSGFFFLLDDAFRMGEYIDVGAAKGAVEKISIRSLRLRHHRGPLNTVPFGEIQTLTNYSRDWVIMKLPLRLTYDTDPQKVKKIIKRIGAEMMADEALSAGLLEAPKSQGVLQMEDSAMILRVKFMAKPGEQFVLRRELLHRIRAAFELEGIQFASREVTVRVAGEHDEETVEKAGAAAARTIMDQEAGAAPASTSADDR